MRCVTVCVCDSVPSVPVRSEGGSQYVKLPRASSASFVLRFLETLCHQLKTSDLFSSQPFSPYASHTRTYHRNSTGKHWSAPLRAVRVCVCQSSQRMCDCLHWRVDLRACAVHVLSMSLHPFLNLCHCQSVCVCASVLECVCVCVSESAAGKEGHKGELGINHDAPVF